MAIEAAGIGHLHEFIGKHIRRFDERSFERGGRGQKLEPNQIARWIDSLNDEERDCLSDRSWFDMLEALLQSLEPSWYPSEGKIKAAPTLKAFCKKSPEQIASLLVVVTVLHSVLLRWLDDESVMQVQQLGNNWTLSVLGHVRAILCARPIEPTLNQFRLLAKSPYKIGRRFWATESDTFMHVAISLGREKLSDPDDLAQLRGFRDELENGGYFGRSREKLNRIDEILGVGDTSPLPNDTPWAEAVNSAIAARPAAQRGIWNQLLRHIGTCGWSKPAKSWFAELRSAIATIDSNVLAEATAQWIDLILAWPPSDFVEMRRRENFEQFQKLLHAEGIVGPYKLGAVWLAGVLDSPAAAATLADFVERVSRTPNNLRFRLVNEGAAAIRALAMSPCPMAAAQLNRLSLRVRWPKFKKLIAKEFDKLVAEKGLDRREVEEASVPDFDLNDGVTTLSFGDMRAALTIGRLEKPSVSWTSADGKVSRVIPKSLKTSHPTAAATVKQTAAEIEAMLTAQRTRLDLLMRRDRSWPIDLWRQRYLDHGLIGTLARRLIWTADNVAVIWRDSQLVDLAGSPVSPSPSATVKLWHPAQQPAADVLAWRQKLADWNITQPFKQAHREIYILTDAELRTSTYSNRFAAHIVKGPTLLAITQARHWKSGTHGGTSSPCCEWPDLPVWADWWLEAAGTEYTPYGAPLYLATDQVRFRLRNDPPTAPLPLSEVPSLIFSETLRDIDLFVGVASVGNDPNWTDGGGRERYHAYWHNYAAHRVAGKVKIRATDGTGGDTNDRIAALLNFRICHRVESNVTHAVIHHCLHADLTCVKADCRKEAQSVMSVVCAFSKFPRAERPLAKGHLRRWRITVRESASHRSVKASRKTGR